MNTTVNTDQRFDLDLTLGDDHHIAVENTLWSEGKGCIVITYDWTQDHRTPALTANEARRLAAALNEAADQLNPLEIVQ
jgi:hypothetical protein